MRFFGVFEMTEVSSPFDKLRVNGIKWNLALTLCGYSLQ